MPHFPAEGLDTATLHSSGPDLEGSGKRKVSDILKFIPSLQSLEVTGRDCKRRKTTESARIQQPSPQTVISSEMIGNKGYTYANLIAEANKGNAPSSIYVSVLLHVVSHCSLCIKYARLTSQMEALQIPYFDEFGLRHVSSSLWFTLPSSFGDTWKHIRLRLGRPGSMYWDVKINDQHFRDLWDLQKGSNSTPWGCGICSLNTSDTDSHIRYDPEGVVLSYNSVECDSVKKLVADIKRLLNARMFALRMRKLLSGCLDEKLENGTRHCDDKLPVGVKGGLEVSQKWSEEMRKAFRIEAVGLMCLSFSFCSGFIARFVVAWESGKEGCTMHVSPDQLWPHTKVHTLPLNSMIILDSGFCHETVISFHHSCQILNRIVYTKPQYRVSCIIL